MLKKQNDEDGGVESKKEAADIGNNKSEELRIAFWNVSGVRKKNFEFWDYIKGYDFIGLVETWVEKQDWDTVEKTLPAEFNWKSVPARREHKKGRAKGGIITGVKKRLVEEDSAFETEHSQERTIKVLGERIRILTVYAREERENTWEAIARNYNEAEEGAVIIGGDFNVRTGEKGAASEGAGKRKSKDKKINKAGREFLRLLRGKNWSILNGTTDGDEDGNFTYSSPSGSSVIDYAVANGAALKAVRRFAVEKRTESDHVPIKITLEVTGRKEKKRDVDGEYEDLIKAIETL